MDESDGPFHRRLYLSGLLDLGNRLRLLRSIDGGATFAESTVVAAERQRMLGNQGNSVVLSDGTYISVWQRLSNESRDGHFSASLATVTSTDGGRSLGAPAPFAQLEPPGFIALPQLAVDRESREFKDLVYAVWVDKSSGRARIIERET